MFAKTSRKLWVDLAEKMTDMRNTGLSVSGGILEVTGHSHADSAIELVVPSGNIAA